MFSTKAVVNVKVSSSGFRKTREKSEFLEPCFSFLSLNLQKKTEESKLIFQPYMTIFK